MHFLSFSENNTIMMNGINSSWEEEYLEMQNQMDNIRFEIIGTSDSVNNYRRQYHDKERELFRVQRILRQLPRVPENIQYLNELQQEEEEINRSMIEIERDIDDLERHREELEQQFRRL